MSWGQITALVDAARQEDEAYRGIGAGVACLADGIASFRAGTPSSSHPTYRATSSGRKPSLLRPTNAFFVSDANGTRVAVEPNVSFGLPRRSDFRGVRSRTFAALALAVAALCTGEVSGADPLMSGSGGFQLASPPSAADTPFHNNPIGACDTGTVTQSLTAADPSYTGLAFSGDGATKTGIDFGGSHTGNSLVDGVTGAAGGVVHAVYDAGHALYTLGKGVYIGLTADPYTDNTRGARVADGNGPGRRNGRRPSDQDGGARRRPRRQHARPWVSGRYRLRRNIDGDYGRPGRSGGRSARSRLSSFARPKPWGKPEAWLGPPRRHLGAKRRWPSMRQPKIAWSRTTRTISPRTRTEGRRAVSPGSALLRALSSTRKRA